MAIWPCHWLTLTPLQPTGERQHETGGIFLSLRSIEIANFASDYKFILLVGLRGNWTQTLESSSNTSGHISGLLHKDLSTASLNQTSLWSGLFLYYCFFIDQTLSSFAPSYFSYKSHFTVLLFPWVLSRCPRQHGANEEETELCTHFGYLWQGEVSRLGFQQQKQWQISLTKAITAGWGRWVWCGVQGASGSHEGSALQGVQPRGHHPLLPHVQALVLWWNFPPQNFPMMWPWRGHSVITAPAKGCSTTGQHRGNSLPRALPGTWLNVLSIHCNIM